MTPTVLEGVELAYQDPLCDADLCSLLPSLGDATGSNFRLKSVVKRRNVQSSPLAGLLVLAETKQSQNKIKKKSPFIAVKPLNCIKAVASISNKRRCGIGPLKIALSSVLFLRLAKLSSN